MDHFQYVNGDLMCEGVHAAALANNYGTPLYVYSRQTLLDHYERCARAFAPLNPLICYSVKSCQNLHICRLLAERGSGFDVVSGGELFRALKAGAHPEKIVFAGVGKSPRELREAQAAGVGWLNVESASELQQLLELAYETGHKPCVALRVNPDVDPKTHVYTTTGKKETKFGVDIDQARHVFERFGQSSALRLCGLHVHIGSPVNDPAAYGESIKRTLALIHELRAAGHPIEALDVGGGFGAFYAGGEAPAAADYARVIVPLLADSGLQIILEPGRSIVGNAGVLLSRVLHVKQSGSKTFVIIDAAMTELIRPALYGAYHFIWPTAANAFTPATRAAQQPMTGLTVCDVVGPVCESGDFLAKDRALPPLHPGDLVAIFTAGAYASSMSSQYNSRPRAAEVLVEGGATRLIRRRETYHDLIAHELC